MNIEISFLTDSEELKSICEKYWNLSHGKKFLYTVKEICLEFNISTNEILKITKNNCIAKTPNDICSICGVPRPLKSRNDFLERRAYQEKPNWKCRNCLEDERIIEKEKEKEVIRYKLINSDLSKQKENGIKIEQMTFEESIYLLSTLRVGGSEDLSFIKPLEHIDGLLSPSSELDREILDHLCRERLICVHPGSHPDSVIIEHNEFTKYFPDKVHWALPIPDNGPSPAKFTENLENFIQSGNWPDEWFEESEKLQRKIALHECFQYLRMVLDDHGFALKIGEKTKLVMNLLLNHFSVAQAYNFIWKAARDAASFYVREHTSKAHAANIVPGSIQRIGILSLLNGIFVHPKVW